MLSEQALCQQGEDEGIGSGLGREGQKMFWGYDGPGEDSGTLFGGDSGQFGAKAASSMASGDQNKFIAEVERTLISILGPILG